MITRIKLCRSFEKTPLYEYQRFRIMFEVPLKRDEFDAHVFLGTNVPAKVPKKK